MENLREQVAEILRHFDKHEIGFQEHTINESVRQILNLFKAEVDKLTVIDAVLIDKGIVKAQLQHTKKQLYNLMGE